MSDYFTGSGSLAAMAVFEDRYKVDMGVSGTKHVERKQNLYFFPEKIMFLCLQLEEAKELVADAIRAGIFNDLGSGSNVDVCVITKDKVDYIRPYDVANEKGKRFERAKHVSFLL